MIRTAEPASFPASSGEHWMRLSEKVTYTMTNMKEKARSARGKGEKEMTNMKKKARSARGKGEREMTNMKEEKARSARGDGEREMTNMKEKKARKDVRPEAMGKTNATSLLDQPLY
ncbi:hypothetical protein T492DRAFT_846608 [Pavlovales sp. CCMP2436]|nr:hypothetical protein T492DRAFT_846608 [Pavlovales sp. CCMP2436]